MSLAAAIAAVRACTLCAADLPNPPRPVFQLDAETRVLIIGQAPGRLAHESGTPWNDPSGDRLRGWLGLDRAGFYDDPRIGLLPMGLCFPGSARGADLPPAARCAPEWHPRLLPLLPERRLTLLVGGYAQRYLGAAARPSLTATVRAMGDYLPDFAPLPHPSWRNNGWLKKNLWFEAETIPALRTALQQALAI